MKICFIDDEPEIFPNQYGGKARTIINLSEKLAQSSLVDNVTILSRSIRHNKEKFLNNGVHFEKMNSSNCIGKIIQKIVEYDIISVHTCSFTFPYISNAKSKVIYNLHDVMYTTIDAGSHMDKSMGNSWSAVISPSNFATKVYENFNWWNKKSNIITIPRGINIDDFYQLKKTESLNVVSKYIDKRLLKNSYPILLFPNRVNAGKGEEYLINLIKNLKKNTRNP